MDKQELKERLANGAFAFRGYNVSNLGRSQELLLHPVYGEVVRKHLREASQVCSDITGKRVDLVDRVRHGRETTLKTYAQAIAIVMAMEDVQLKLLSEHFDIEITDAKFALGYSLGEISALALSGVFDLYESMQVPLSLAEPSIELAEDVSLGVLFSRGEALSIDQVNRMCLEINLAGEGVIGISAHLSPNSFLLMGQGSTIERFKASMKQLPENAHLRKNSNRFPPLHTPIVWQRQLRDRAAEMMHTMRGGFVAPNPPVLSLVTGSRSYNDHNVRETLRDWIDHPQLLWDAVYETLRSNVDLIVHVGPEPNIIVATFKRLKDNVEAETKGRIGVRALTTFVHHPWIKPLLPHRAALLKAPLVQNIVLEDWLLDQDLG